MPSIIQVSDLRSGYVDVVEAVRENGARSAPRGQATRELLDVIIELRDPYDALPVGTGRGVVRGIGYVEAAQLIGQTSTPDILVRVSSNFESYLEPSGMQHGAYGIRTAGQIQAVIDKLHRDPEARQAVTTLWDPNLDNVIGKRDYPCTVMFQFLIRDEALIMHTTMRSNDVWLGLAYDAFQFTQLQISVARALGLEVGPYHHHAVSLHMYERDVEASYALIRPDESVAIERLEGFGHPGDDWSTISSRARAILLNCPNAHLPMTDTERAYLRVLHPQEQV